ncbi:DsbA family protein [Streptomyces coelicoflavus]|uniref:Disulfide bond formation protein DsbA n=2 Tax=Streptomyces TaxID=1883 RepID=A0A369UVA9_9ACTN|nr:MULTISPECIES: thioredoxin domain-containing protein [Streptomyces]MYS46613.1 thioredoxin domain-containing protein [Streptomyces sp. SID5998]WDI21523.1 thioredoxin domain-containing protein [Streptomyces enissocaesilis]AIV33334.1 DSBA oxidoreductase [Streptomyces sp. CCM_MD2014]MCT7350604.1 thioredoxin domain-containing protein [Streptomyces sp. 15-116A]MCW1097648.1 thioredoxin domain-containing protein [Streptomyces sp. RS2]
MTKNLKISLALVAIVAAIVAALLAANRMPDAPAQASDSGEGKVADASVLVRPDSHRLSTAKDGKVTVVEFLDLECESCRAAFPVVERLRKEYEGRVTFVMRYFPIPTHKNAELAARAVEAASKQGKLEAMYQKMYETQESWGDQQVSHEETFRGFAKELGLDMKKFEADWKDPATAKRVDKDRQDGLALGVQGTPTFFINDHRPQIQSEADFRAAIEAELAK